MKRIIKNILSIPDFIYYRSFKREGKKWAAIPKMHAILNVSLVEGIYVFIFSFLAEFLFGIQLYTDKNEGISSIVIFIIANFILVINYFIFNYKKRYLKVLEKYDNIEKKIRIKYNLKVNLFIIFSLVLAVILAIISIQINY